MKVPKKERKRERHICSAHPGDTVLDIGGISVAPPQKEFVCKPIVVVGKIKQPIKYQNSTCVCQFLAHI